MKRFNVRIYGLLINDNEEVLVSDEYQNGCSFTKFPGGGLEYGEGTIDCLKREFVEECEGMKIEVLNHFYTTDFFQKSAFDESQVISIYYLIKSMEPISLSIKTKKYDFEEFKDGAQQFRWLYIPNLNEDQLSFPIDKKVASLLIDKYK